MSTTFCVRLQAESFLWWWWGDCLKTQTSSVKIDTKLVKMALNMDLKDKKMTKKIVFRQSEGGGVLPPQ